MSIRTLKRLAFILPLLFIGGVLILFRLLDPSISWRNLLVVLMILGGGTILFTFWAFRLIERQEGEVRQRSEQLDALRKAALALTEELDLATVLQRVVDQARTLVGARYGALGVLEENGEFIAQFLTSGISPEQRARLGPPPRGHGLLGALIKEGEPIRIPNIASDSRSVGFPPNHPEMRSLLGVPIKFNKEILGDLYLTNKLTSSGEVTVFSQQDQDLLEMFASHAAIAIQNARLYRQSQQLSRLQERERFGMDLHDGVIQSIYAVGLMLDDAQYRAETGQPEVKTTIAQAIEGLNDVIRDIRNYILDLRPQRFQGRHLPEGLEELAREVRAHSFINVDINIVSEDWTQLPPEQTVEILHIAREALVNIRKHARASKVDITLARQDGSLLLEIADNGIGFDPVHLPNDIGNGLRNMQERAQALGGKILFNRADSGGTSVQLNIPFFS
ncbi:MAG TPA: GAF domain-containing sensor histidine kinase [Anaerolineales bacterium]|nr:GAF domain-containing sensor histidine kinase [Anaerolineales bacterium]